MEKTNRIQDDTKGSAALALVCAAAALMVALSSPGCAARAGGEGEKTGHGSQAEGLALVMRGFDASVRRDIPEQTDEYDRWEGVFPRIADSADALAKSAVELSGRPPDGLELPERGRFSVLARSLADAAGELRDAAARGDADAVELARARTGRACRDCHDRFRPNAPGLPEAFR